LDTREGELLQLSELKPVVVASTDLLPGVAIEETMVAETQVPQKFLQPGAIATLRDVVGQIPAVPIPKGAQVTGTSMTGVGRGLATKIPRGKRAISIAVTEVSGVSGLIRPNNYVDIMGIITTGSGLGAPDQRAMVVTLLQNVMVLAVGQDIGEVKPEARPASEQEALDILAARQREGVNSVTLAVSPQEAQDLALAQQIGDVSFTLRSYLERDTRVELGRSTVPALLGSDEKVVPRRMPSWREFRGGAQ
jgi:pilus assembly protein CpaB